MHGKNGAILTHVNLLLLTSIILIIGIVWRHIDIFILNLDEAWTNILPSKLFPLLLILVIFWFYRRTEIESVLGLNRSNLKGHLVIGFLIGLVLFVFGDMLAAIIYSMFFDSSQSLEFIIIEPDLLWYSIIFFFINATYEEILFRGLLQRSFTHYTSINRAIFISAVIFGFYHLIWPVQSFIESGTFSLNQAFVMVVFSGILGSLFGIYFERFSEGKCLTGPITAHWLLNSLNENCKFTSPTVVPGPDVLLVAPLQMGIALILVTIAFISLFYISLKYTITEILSKWRTLLRRLPIQRFSKEHTIVDC